MCRYLCPEGEGRFRDVNRLSPIYAMLSRLELRTGFSARYTGIVLVARHGARAEVYLHGAHVTSWVPAGDGVVFHQEEERDFGGWRTHDFGLPR